MKLPLNLVEQVKSVAAARSCGICTACCVLPRIQPAESVAPLPPEGKPGYTPCIHLAHSCGTSGCGCMVYEDRPPVCSGFECLWRAGYIAGDERRRPDNLGLMFTVDVEGREVVEAWELWEGAARDHPGRSVLDAIAARAKVAVRYYGVPCSLHYQGPASLLSGANLSRAAREDPKGLARWLENLVRTGELEDPHNIAKAGDDLVRLKEGRGVEPHFGPNQHKVVAR